MNVLFVCTSNKDRSPALEQYFRENFSKHFYRSCGINKYHCEQKGTKYMNESDADWAELVIFCEDIHRDVFMQAFPRSFYQYVMLRLGDYQSGHMAQYCKDAESILRSHL